MSSAGYAAQLAALLPPGRLWRFEPGSGLYKALQAVGDELERVRLRGVDLLNEADPRTATETLSDWERAVGLPDAQVTAIPATTAERRVAVAQKMTARGGQNYSFFDALCAACGYPLLSIDRFADSLFRAGRARVGDRVYGAAWAYAMRLNLGPATAGALSHADFERVIAHAIHSHIQTVFTYA